MKGLFAAAAAVLILAAPAYGQDAREANKAPRRLLLAIGEDPEGALTPDGMLRIEKSLALALAAVEGISVLEYGRKKFPDSLEKRIEAAETLGADCWLLITVSMSGDTPVATASSFDVALLALAFEVPVPSSDLSGEWGEVVPLVSRLSRAASAEELSASHEGKARLTIRARPGTRITGIPGGPLDVGSDGTISVRVETPTTLTLRASLMGYYPVEQNIFLDSHRTVEMPQEPGSRWAFELHFYDALFPGLDAELFAVPNSIFLELGVTSFLFGLQLSDNAAFTSLPLTVFAFRAGFYIGPEDGTFRPYIAAGGFLRISGGAGAPPRIEPASPGGFELVLATEMALTLKSRFFIEYVPAMYMSAVPELLRASFSQGTAFVYLPLPWGGVSFLNFRFGLRWLQ